MQQGDIYQDLHFYNKILYIIYIFIVEYILSIFL